MFGRDKVGKVEAADGSPAINPKLDSFKNRLILEITHLKERLKESEEILAQIENDPVVAALIERIKNRF